MRLISRKALGTYWEKHPQAEDVINDWFRKVKRLDAYSLSELRKTFPVADPVGDCVVFNVGGNNYRVIVHLDYDLQITWIRAVSSHAEGTVSQVPERQTRDQQGPGKKTVRKISPARRYIYLDQSDRR